MVAGGSMSRNLRAPEGRGRQRMGGASPSSGQMASHVEPHSGHCRNSSHSAMSTACQRITESSSMVAQSGRFPQEQLAEAPGLLGMGCRVPDLLAHGQSLALKPTKSVASVYTAAHARGE